jgi:myo-inositol-1(or 4)-monophosphatase
MPAVRGVLAICPRPHLPSPTDVHVHHDLDADLELALRAARAAGAAILPAFRTEQDVRYKSADQPVTAADLEADRVLAALLRGERPGYGWLSEETADGPERLTRPLVWIVDPIDGTSSFVAGELDFVVSVGLARDGVAVLGVVHAPVTGETYHAVAGGGAFRDGSPVRVSGAPSGARRPRMAGSRWEIRRGALEALGDAWELVPLGSTAYKMMKVADGTVDAYLSLGIKGEWDVCAAQVVLEEAGGTVTRLDGSRVRYNRSEPAWTGLAASGGALHREVLAAAARIGTGGGGR